MPPRTNMTAAEVIPELGNPAHDPRFWCLPPVRDQPNTHPRGHFPMYLVTQGERVGVWHSWTMVQAMVSGHSSGSQRGHRTMINCISEWQEYCALGLHPHPPAPPALEWPNLAVLHLDTGTTTEGTSSLACDNNGGTESPTDSPTSSVTSTEWEAVPEGGRYFALWGGQIVYADRLEAHTAFLEAERNIREYPEEITYSSTNPFLSFWPKRKKMCAVVVDSPLNMGPPDTPPVQDVAMPLANAPAPTREDGETPRSADALSPAVPNGDKQLDLPLDAPRSLPPLDVPPSSPLDAPPSQPLDAPPSPPLDAPGSQPQVVVRQRVQRPRHTKGQPKAQPGKQSWVFGTKLKFFACKIYAKKYGVHLADNEDLADDVEDSPDSVVDEVVHEVLSGEEVEFCVSYMRSLRTQIGTWYRSEYGHLLKSDDAAFKELFAGILGSTPPKPQRPRMSHVEEHLAALNRHAELAGENPPWKIDVISKVTAERWEAETTAFKEECQVSMEHEFQAALKGWENSALGNIAHYVTPFIEVIEQRFGMCTSLMLAGPIGIRGGRIGIVAGKLARFRLAGFRAAGRSMISFAKECFLEAECLARVVEPKASDANDMPTAEDGPSPTPSATAAAPAPRIPAWPTPPATSALVTSNPAMSTPATLTTPPGPVPATPTPLPIVAMPISVPGGPAAGGRASQEGGDGTRDGEGEGGSTSIYDAHWQRVDRVKWPEELRKAHVAFECGKVGGGGGMDHEGKEMDGTVVPPRGIGHAGHQKLMGFVLVGVVEEPAAEGSGPGGQGTVVSGNGILEGDYEDVQQKRLLQVMATLVWWGDTAWRRKDKEQGAWDIWLLAVDDVTWVIAEVLESGDNERLA
ncbi:hypothetical protein C8R45DRAFT_921961 [Mycena sanguinolenta]|nr:hypothetical protein C8R45DRAFT_921961 [Mycena sanguinolenta]